MKLILSSLLAAAVSFIFVMPFLEARETFSAFILSSDVPSTTTVDAAENIVLVSGNSVRVRKGLASDLVMAPNASNAVLPTARTNLGLGTTSNVTFNSLTLNSTISNLLGTTLSSPGLSTTAWDGLSGRWSLGTAVAPSTSAGPLVQLSKTQQVASTSCDNNALDVSCSAALSVIVTNTASDQMQVTAIYGNASTNTANDSVGGFFMGSSKSGSTAIGTGFYAEGIADSGGGKAMAGEFRTTNNKANGSYQSSGFSGTGGLWITAGGGFTSAEGIGIGAVNGQNYTVGVACKSGGCGTNFLRDDSSSTASIQINGAHSYAFISDSTAGFVGFGTLTPSANLHVVRPGNDGSQAFRITQGDRDYDFFRNTSTDGLVIKNEEAGDVLEAQNSSGVATFTATSTGVKMINLAAHVVGQGGAGNFSSTGTTLATIGGLDQAFVAAGYYSCSGHLHFTTAPTGSNGVKLALVGDGVVSVSALQFTADARNSAALVTSGFGTATALGSNAIAVTAAMTDVYLSASIKINVAGTIHVQAAENAASGTIAVNDGNGWWNCHRAA